jgi:hypothetical protein
MNGMESHRCEVPDGPGATLPWPTRLVAQGQELTFHSAGTHDARYRDEDGAEVLVYPYTTLGSESDRRPFSAVFGWPKRATVAA